MRSRARSNARSTSTWLRVASPRSGRVFVSGGSAYLHPLCAAVEKRARVPVIVFDPMLNLTVDTKFVNEVEMRSRAAQLVVALGLALRQDKERRHVISRLFFHSRHARYETEEPRVIRVNLLAAQKEKRTRSCRHRRFIGWRQLDMAASPSSSASWSSRSSASRFGTRTEQNQLVVVVKSTTPRSRRTSTTSSGRSPTTRRSSRSSRS